MTKILVKKEKNLITMFLNKEMEGHPMNVFLMVSCFPMTFMVLSGIDSFNKLEQIRGWIKGL